MRFMIILSCCFFACSPHQDPQAKQALTRFAYFVDSIDAMNTYWKTSQDTFFMERCIDPNNLSKREWDTTIITPDMKKTILYADEFGALMSVGIKKQFDSLYKNTLALEPEMNKEMKEELNASIKKYEAMLPPGERKSKN